MPFFSINIVQNGILIMKYDPFRVDDKGGSLWQSNSEGTFATTR